MINPLQTYDNLIYIEIYDHYDTFGNYSARRSIIRYPPGASDDLWDLIDLATEFKTIVEINEII